MISLIGWCYCLFLDSLRRFWPSIVVFCPFFPAFHYFFMRAQMLCKNDAIINKAEKKAEFPHF